MADDPELGAVVADQQPTVAPSEEPVEGRFVKLVRMTEADFPSLWLALGVHKEIWKHWPAGPYDQDGFNTAMQELLDMPSLANYTIYQQGEVVGIIILMPVDLKVRVMEIGMMYGPRIQRTRGATEAVYLLACMTFDQLNNRRLQWKTDRMNVPSCRSAERYGLVYEGCLRQKGITKGRNRDEVWYAMIDSDWPVCKRAFEQWLDDANFDESGSQKHRLGDIRAKLIAEEGANRDETGGEIGDKA